MFIVFEGGEAVGKSTQIELVFNALQNKNLPAVKTREPGGTPLAENIRNLFKAQSTDPPTPLTELYLVSAARAQHVHNVIQPALKQNKIILCDRFLDSTYVYQHILGKVDKQIIDQTTKPILQGLKPHLTFVFACDINISLNRRNNEQHRTLDRLDTQAVPILESILHGYNQVYNQSFTYPCGTKPLRVLINATQPKEDIFNSIKLALKTHLQIII